MGVCLLVINEDMACRDIVSHLLKICDYSEVYTGILEDTLGMINSDKRLPERNPALMSNLKRLGRRGIGVLLQIRQFFKSPSENILFYDMKADAKWVRPKLGEQLNCSLYILNISGHEQIETLWKSATVISKRSRNTRRKEKRAGIEASAVKPQISLENSVSLCPSLSLNCSLQQNPSLPSFLEMNSSPNVPKDLVTNSGISMPEGCDSEPAFGAPEAENTANSSKAVVPSAAVDETEGWLGNEIDVLLNEAEGKGKSLRMFWEDVHEYANGNGNLA